MIIAGTATIGAYTTFSTWMLETQRLAEDGQFFAGLMNVVISLIVGFGAVALGHSVGTLL
jgi:fluoride exporter